MSGPYAQTDFAAIFNQQVNAAAAATAKTLVATYLRTRAYYLGIPQGQASPSGNQTPRQQWAQVPLTLRQRLAARGANATLDLAANSTFKADIEAIVNAAIGSLGGAGSINPNDPGWGFVLQFVPVTAPVAPATTPTYGVFSLPSVPFAAKLQNGSFVNVNIAEATSGDASLLIPVFTDAGGNAVSPDPF